MEKIVCFTLCRVPFRIIQINLFNYPTRETLCCHLHFLGKPLKLYLGKKRPSQSSNKSHEQSKASLDHLEILTREDSRKIVLIRFFFFAHTLLLRCITVIIIIPWLCASLPCNLAFAAKTICKYHCDTRIIWRWGKLSSSLVSCSVVVNGTIEGGWSVGWLGNLM